MNTLITELMKFKSGTTLWLRRECPQMELSNIYFFLRKGGIRTMMIQKKQQQEEFGNDINRVLGNKKNINHL